MTTALVAPCLAPLQRSGSKRHPTPRTMTGTSLVRRTRDRTSSILHTPAAVSAGLPAIMRDVALREGKWEGTVIRVRKDGSRFTARVVLTPRRGPDGQPVGLVLISKDISDEIRLTEGLEATQFYNRSLIESNIDALMTTDPVALRR